MYDDPLQILKFSLDRYGIKTALRLTSIMVLIVRFLSTAKKESIFKNTC